MGLSAPKEHAIFEQQWVINSILWGNYARLRDATLDEMGSPISGRTLQVACVYGNLTLNLLRHRADARLDVVDVAPIQLENLSRKLNGDGNRVFLDRQDASSLDFNDASFDQVLMFFYCMNCLAKPESVPQLKLCGCSSLAAN